MKKMVALACVGLMAASVVTGCSSKKDDASSGSDGEKRIVKFDAFSGGNGEEVWKEMAKAFEAKNKDVKIELRFEKDLPAVLNKENSKGEYSDIVYYNLGQQSQFTETQLNSKKVEDISDVFADENVKKNINPDFVNNPVSQFYGDGKNYLAPIMYTPGGLYYNANLVGEGKKYEIPQTWDDMFKLGDQLKEEGKISLFTYAQAGYLDNTILSVIQEAGGQELLSKLLNYDAEAWKSKEGKMVTDTIGRLVKDYMEPNTVANANVKDGFTKNQQAVIDGKALFMPNGSWVVAEMEETTPKDFKWGVSAVPALTKDGKKAITTFTEQCWIPSEAKNKDDAKAFLKFIYSEEGANIMLKYNCVVPVNGITDKLTGVNKELYNVYNDENVTAVIGAFAPFDSAAIPDVDMKKVLCFTADDINTGKTTAEKWNSELVKTWKTISEHPVK